jgi:peptidoglycan/xylan/chitin deacetylase (PgdA/CDA1 family)
VLLAVLVLATACTAGAPSHRAESPKPSTVPSTLPAPRVSNPPSPQARSAAAPVVVRHGRRDRRQVALTFDSNLTPYMERELDQHRVSSFDDVAAIDELIRLRVPATFFLSGRWMARYPAETRRLARVPFFELGSHGYSHRAFTPRCYGLGVLPRDQMTSDIERSEQILRRLEPRATRLFRFPGGCFDRFGLAAAAAAHVQVVQYDVASGDAFGRSVHVIVEHTLSSVRNGSIVVLHITGGNTAPLTPQALPSIVQGLRAQGYTLVTVSHLIADTA